MRWLTPLWYALVGLSVPSLLRDLGYAQTNPEWVLLVLIFDTTVLAALVIVSFLLLMRTFGGIK